MQVTTTRPKITVTADGQGVVSHAGSRLLADVADRTTLTGELSEVLAELCKPRARHDPGRVLVDMAVAVADGATTISDVAVHGSRQVIWPHRSSRILAPVVSGQVGFGWWVS
ncbi:MAG: transposase [Actinomycetota bacterium]|nr:transposase [Actinomycetota bacterium]